MSTDPSLPDSRAPAPEGAFDLEGEVALFGYESTVARARILARSRGWRVGGALRRLGIFVAIAPFVAILPPHAVWLIGSLATGGLLARRRYVERFTLTTVDGTCPNCGAALGVKPARLREPHPLPCEACHHESTLRLPAGALDAHRVE